MKRCILSAIAGALVMLLVISIASEIYENQELPSKKYEHIDYVSNITPEECYICADISEFQAFRHWGEDNVGIVNLNTFELLHLNINPYDEYGNMIEQPVGVMFSSHMSKAHAFTHPDSAFADVHLSDVKYEISRNAVQAHLCQTCLDGINTLCFTTQPPAEFAIVSYEERTIQPLLDHRPWFSAGNYGVACEFRDEGAIDLLIHYIAYRGNGG